MLPPENHIKDDPKVEQRSGPITPTVEISPPSPPEIQPTVQAARTLTSTDEVATRPGVRTRSQFKGLLTFQPVQLDTTLPRHKKKKMIEPKPDGDPPTKKMTMATQSTIQESSQPSTRHPSVSTDRGDDENVGPNTIIGNDGGTQAPNDPTKGTLGGPIELDGTDRLILKLDTGSLTTLKSLYESIYSLGGPKGERFGNSIEPLVELLKRTVERQEPSDLVQLLLQLTLNSTDTLASQLVDTRVDFVDIVNDQVADLTALSGQIMPRLERLDEGIESLRSIMGSKEEPVPQIMKYMDSRLQTGFQSLKQSWDGDQNRFCISTNGRIDSLDEKSKRSASEILKRLQANNVASEAKSMAIEVKTDDCSTRLLVAELDTRRLEKQVEELSTKLNEVTQALKDNNTHLTYRWNDTGHRVELQGPISGGVDDSSLRTSPPGSARNPMAPPLDANNPEFLESIWRLIDDRGPNEDERKYDHRVEIGVEHLLESARSPATDHVNKIYHVLSSACRARSARESAEHPPLGRHPRAQFDERRTVSPLQARREPTPASQFREPSPLSTNNTGPPTPSNTYRDERTPAPTTIYQGVNRLTSLAPPGVTTTPMRAINMDMERLEEMIDRTTGMDPDALNTTRKVNIPQPKVYKGENDPEYLEAWLHSLLENFYLTRVVGPGSDGDRVRLAGQYLEDEAELWYRDEVWAPKRRDADWSFKETIFQLYRRFITQTSTVKAADQYRKVKYDPTKGVLSFHNELNRHAGRMAQRPDDYSFKSHVLSGLPSYIQEDIIRVHRLHAETDTIGDIIEAAVIIERGRASIERIGEYRSRNQPTSNSRNNERTNITRPPPSERDRNGRPNMFRQTNRPPILATNSGNPPKVTQNTTAIVSNQALIRKPSVTRDRSREACHSCGQTGHWRNDPICPNHREHRARQARMEGTTEIAIGETDYADEADEAALQYRYDEDTQDIVEDRFELMEEQGETAPDSGVRFQEVDAEETHGSSSRLYVLRILTNEEIEEEDLLEANTALNEEGNAQLLRVASTLPDNPPVTLLYDGNIRPRTGDPPQPNRSPSSQHCLTVMMSVNGIEAYTLIDTGSTLDTISLDFARATHVPQFALKQVLRVQLGMQGSRGKVATGSRVELSAQGITIPRYYVDVSNIDKYQMILGTPFLRRHNVCCDFSNNTITIGDTIIKCLPVIEDEIEYRKLPRKVPENATQATSMAIRTNPGSDTLTTA